RAGVLCVLRGGLGLPLFAGATQRRNARSQDANQEEGRPAPAPRNAYAPPLTLTQRSGSGRERAAEPTAGEERSTRRAHGGALQFGGDRKSTRLNSSHVKTSYAVFCLKKKMSLHPYLLYH